MEELKETIAELRTTIDGLVCKNSQFKSALAIVQYEIGKIRLELDELRKEFPETRNDHPKRNVFGY